MISEKYFNPEIKKYLSKFANWDSKYKSVSLTFDIDWAPDFMIEEIINILEIYSIKATFFATHESKVLQNLNSSKNYEVGLHPYIGKNSTQGRDSNEILTKLKNTYPDSEGCRFHILEFSYRDLLNLKNYGLKYDISRIMFNSPFLLPAYHSDLNLVLLQYSWEDGVSENQGINPSIHNVDLETPGLKILNFHPMNIYINCPNSNHRKEFQLKNPILLESTRESVNPFVYKGIGSKNALIEICEYIKNKKITTYKISEYSTNFPKVPYHVKN